MSTAFPINPELTAIAIGYRNRDVDLIADRVLPRVPTALRFAYTVYHLADAFTVPSTLVGRRSEPTMVEFGGTLTQAECVDYGLDDLVPNHEIEAYEAMGAALAQSPLARSTQLLAGLVMLDREIRVRDLVFNAASYAAGHTVTLSGTSQWSDFANSNPLDAILQACDIPLVRPNTIVLGQRTWTRMRQHPRLIQAANASAHTGGAITRAQLAELIEVPNVIVGSGWLNTARRGQTPNMVRVWGNHAALLHVSEDAAATNQPTFGFTAQFGSRIAGEMDSPVTGLRGGVRLRVGESVREVISAPGAGYYFANAVA